MHKYDQENCRILFEEQLVVPSNDKGKGLCLDLIEKVNLLFHFERDLLFSFYIVVTESVDNAIRHGNKGNEDEVVNFSLTITTNKIHIRVEDHGEGYDFNDIPSPCEGMGLRKECGRGIFLIKKVSSRCYTEGCGNILVIIIDR